MMQKRRIVKTTLGDLVVALTDEVTPIISDPAGVYIIVSSLLDEVLTRQRLRDHTLSRQS